MATTIQVLSHIDTKEIDDKIKAILARGNTASFLNTTNGIVKHVTEWCQDQQGDLLASYSTGTVFWVCPYAVGYQITEIEGKTNDNGEVP